MTEVWRRLGCRGSELLLALAIADIAGDDGRNVFPGVAHLAAKTRQSERTVGRQLKAFRRVEWLIVEEAGGLRGGRRRPTRYRINSAWINGDSLSGIPDIGEKGDIPSPKGCQTESQRVTSQVGMADTAVSEYPSGSIDPSGSVGTASPSLATASSAAPEAGAHDARHLTARAQVLAGARFSVARIAKSMKLTPAEVTAILDAARTGAGEVQEAAS